MICAYPATLSYQQNRMNIYSKQTMSRGYTYLDDRCLPCHIEISKRQDESLFKDKHRKCPGGIHIYMICAFPATSRYQQNKMNLYPKENADNVQVGIHIYVICAFPATLRYQQGKINVNSNAKAGNVQGVYISM